MPQIVTKIKRDSELYRDNMQAMNTLVEEMETRVTKIKQGGGVKAIERQRAKGKLPVRERITTCSTKIPRFSKSANLPLGKFTMM